MQVSARRGQGITISIQQKNVVLVVLGTLGFSVVAIWSDLLGHSSGFALSTSSIQALGNARIFFLVGFTATAAMSMFVRHIGVLQASFLRMFFPSVSCAGTLLFGLAYSQQFMSSEVLAIVGLAICGVGYYGMAVSFFIELAKAQHFSTAVWVIAVSLFLKTALGDAIGFSVSESAQVTLTTLLPLVALVCLVCMRAVGTDEYLLACQSKPLPKKSAQNLIYFFVSASVIVAALRGFSHLGLWGTGYLGPSISSLVGYLVVGLLLASFTYLALVRNSDNQMLKRYQPAFLVLISGFLVYIIVSQVDATTIKIEVLIDYFVSAELFGHLLLRSVVFTAIRTNVMAGWRIQGIGDTAYGITSIVWAILLQDAIVSVQLLIIIALFFSMAAAVRPLNKNPYETEMALSPSTGASSESGASSIVASAKSPETLGDQTDFSESITLFHRYLAKKFSLSPRETEVFLLVAQGRSRPYISQTIYLSDGTVKTHIAHIYKKFNVSSRQELLTVIQEAQGTWKRQKDIDAQTESLS